MASGCIKCGTVFQPTRDQCWCDASKRCTKAAEKVTTPDPRTHEWPYQTNYQETFCNGYAPTDHICQNCKPKPRVPPAKPQQKVYTLLDDTPLSVADKHLRGAHNPVPDRVGVAGKEELGRYLDTYLGPRPYSHTEEEDLTYTPNYRYRDWLLRPMPQICRDTDSKVLIVRLPPSKREHYDFYTKVRMGREPRKVLTTDLPGDPYVSCNAMPIPIYMEVPRRAEYD